MQMKQRVFSGIQPSGASHLGTYLGALKNWVAVQEEYESYFCIVDLHALTVPQDPKVLRTNVREMAAIFIAVGLDPTRSIIFRQSRVAEHTELGWLLNCIARVGELSRMTQFKDKSQKGGAESASVALYDYPVLQAADILLYVIRRKIRRAKTDSGSEVTASPEKPALTNLLGIYAGLTSQSISGIENQYRGKGYGDFKKDLAEVVVESLSPIRERTLELLDDPR